MGYVDDVRRAAKRAGRNLDDVADAVLEDAAQVIDHPGYAAAGPLGLVIADLNRRGAFKSLTKGIRNVENRIGGVLRGPRRSGGDHTKPKNLPVNTKKENGYCAPNGRKPFPLIGRIAIAAGALTQGTDAGDFHSTTANPTIITTSDLIPGNVIVESCALSLGVVFVTTLGAETLAVLENFWYIERVNGTEIARWTGRDLGLTIDHSGALGTAFAASSQFRVSGEWKDWPRTYDPNVPQALVAQIGRTFTFVNALELTLQEAGSRP